MGPRNLKGRLVHHLAKGAVGFMGRALLAAFHVSHVRHGTMGSPGHGGAMTDRAGSQGDE